MTCGDAAAVADIMSERWPASDRNSGRFEIGIRLSRTFGAAHARGIRARRSGASPFSMSCAAPTVNRQQVTSQPKTPFFLNRIAALALLRLHQKCGRAVFRHDFVPAVLCWPGPRKRAPDSFVGNGMREEPGGQQTCTLSCGCMPRRTGTMVSALPMRQSSPVNGVGRSDGTSLVGMGAGNLARRWRRQPR